MTTENSTRSMSIAELLNRAKSNIEAGDNHMRQAAEDIAAASEQGATQRQIAEAVGKSAMWVNGLLRWRLAGYPATAFGPQSKAARDKSRVQATVQQKPASTSEQAQAATARAEAEKAKAEAAAARARAQQAKADAAKAKADNERQRRAREEMFGGLSGRYRSRKKINNRDRVLLVKSLGMLGSNQAGERDAAALTVEKMRKKLDASWDDLIIEAASSGTSHKDNSSNRQHHDQH
jgi:hypothetical protein